jgi:hypothetical protein
MRQGLTMFDADGKLVVWNKRYVEMYGMSPEIVRRTIGALLDRMLVLFCLGR